MGASLSSRVLQGVVFVPPPPRLDAQVIALTRDIPSESEAYRIPAIHIAYPGSRTVIVYSHGNGEDLASVCAWCQEFSTRLRVDVVAWDYCGYGMHLIHRDNTTASENNVKSDILAVMEHTARTLPDKRMVLYGRSLGSGPTLYGAARDTSGRVQGIIVESGFLTCIKTVLNTSWTAPFDMFRNEHEILGCSMPTLIVHGTHDRVVPFAHGKQLHALAPNAWKTGVWIENGTHNNLNNGTHATEVLHSIDHFLTDVVSE